MKKITQLLLAVTIIFFAVSCKNTSEKKPTVKQPQKTETQHKKHVEKLQLNNGNLWEANIETTNGIDTMLQLMNDFSEKENPEAYIVLKQNLETQFKTIIKECTMTGEAHEQLHVFIVPLQGMFNGLTVVNNDTRTENFNKLNSHLKEYKTYFK